MDLLKGKRILVIDDAEAERMLISTYLQQHGCRLYHAFDGADGVHKAKLLHPDLILMDVDMPRCNGYVACKALKGDPVTADVPVVFLSAFSSPEQRVQGLLAGAVDFIGKPYEFEEVRLRLSIHLRHCSALNRQPPSRGSGEPAQYQEYNNYETNLYTVLFQSARLHLLNSLEAPPSIEALARQVGTNSKRLNAAFKHCADMTVFEYLREERMREAYRLLRHSRLSVSDIALSVGFSSSANFATAFKARYDMSPTAFRRQIPLS